MFSNGTECGYEHGQEEESTCSYATAVDCEKETNNFTKTHTTSNFRFDTGSNLDSEKFFVIVCGG